MSYKWERDEGQSEDINDTFWILIKLENERKLAIGLVYFATEGSVNRKWDDEMR